MASDFRSTSIEKKLDIKKKNLKCASDDSPVL